MRRLLLFALALLFVISYGTSAQARPHRVAQIPNGAVNACWNCHINPGGGGPRNAFGTVIEHRFLTEIGPNGDVTWVPLLASLDSDNDGVSNGQELQDSYGLWTEGEPDPGDPLAVTHPGDDTSTPLSVLTMHFEGMDPHVGQKLEVRVIDKATRKEAARQTLPSVPSPSFDMQFDLLLDDNSYWIDFYADLSGNGLYDVPPTDHAWRLDLDEAPNDTTLTFVHNTTFTDIDWKYLFTLRFDSMDPHLGQMLQMRVDDNLTGVEVGRARYESIATPAFDLSVPGISVGGMYEVSFFADLNNNGLYDPPPTDHAWKLEFTNSTGDVTLGFTHNTDFTDTGWEYLFTQNNLEMNPHLGQLFELRVVDNSNEIEIGRTSVESVPLPSFSAYVPGIELGDDYRSDFYADFNGNGVYDVPPTDHAWRIPFQEDTGDVVINFIHNTDFTDINWPPTGIEPEEEKGLPKAFALGQNYPNPFNPSTTIAFTIPGNAGEKKPATLTIYDLRGRRVRTLLDSELAPGTHKISWDGRDERGHSIASGVYFFTLSTGDQSLTRKMIATK
jgi:hypothetical protein